MRDCLAAYPHFADELSPMLQSVGLLKGYAKALPTPQQIDSMQASYLNQVHTPKSISVFASPMALAIMAAAVTAVVIGVGAFFSVNQNQAASPIAIGEPPTEVAVSAFTELDTETATTTPTETTTTTVTSTQTETETVTATTTETGTVTTTATEAETVTVTATETEIETGTTTTTATETEAETETVTTTATETSTETTTATPTATQTATRTPTRTFIPTATRTATAVPQVAQAASVPQPESNASGGGTTGSSTSGGSGSSMPGPAEGIQEPLGSAATQCILANSCLLLDNVANTGGVKAGDATTLIFTVNQREISVDIGYDQPGEAACEMGYCVLFQSDGTIFWFTRGTSDNISHIQFWDFSDDTDRDGIPDVQDLCPLDARDRCTPKPVILTTICHISPGNPDKPRTIRIDESAVEAHLDHGDTLGACPQTPGQGSG